MRGYSNFWRWRGNWPACQGLRSLGFLVGFSSDSVLGSFSSGWGDSSSKINCSREYPSESSRSARRSSLASSSFCFGWSLSVKVASWGIISSKYNELPRPFKRGEGWRNERPLTFRASYAIIRRATFCPRPFPQESYAKRSGPHHGRGRRDRPGVGGAAG